MHQGAILSWASTADVSLCTEIISAPATTAEPSTLWHDDDDDDDDDDSSAVVDESQE